jgi:hypothetical protein
MSAAHPKRTSRPLNLRDFPEDLYWQCKVKAAEQHMHLKDFIVDTLQRALNGRVLRISGGD